ncbi:hypothetical protein E2C01_016210 [Portunus trituberculatus]|uniref:Uncharacterized protein n=1 Tax=Portunus trituberculatus TaxID=210409 RepID=A0A5B7DNH5_PORTR|nr:hypothetical protein [Portunus trituberculatus]
MVESRGSPAFIRKHHINIGSVIVNGQAKGPGFDSLIRHHRPETRNVAKMRGKGSMSVLCVRNTSARETSGEAQKMMLPRQHIRPIYNFKSDISKSSK